MKKSSKRRISSLLCAAMMATTAVMASPLSASAAGAETLERDKLIGSHLGLSSSSIPVNFAYQTSVDYVTGNLFLQLNTPVNHLELSYNSQDTADSELGTGFTSRFHQSVEVYRMEESTDIFPHENDWMIHKDADGKRVFLEPHKTESGESYWGDFYEDSLRFSPTGYAYDNEYQHQMFERNGELTFLTLQRLDYREIFQVDMRADLRVFTGTIDGVPSRTVALQNRNERLMQITDQSYFGHQEPTLYQFDYDANGRLAACGRLDWNDIHYRFAYGTELSGITNVVDSATGKTLEIGYTQLDGLYKVTFIKVTDANGTVVDQKQFAYGNGQTVVIDRDGSMTIKTY